MIGSVGAATQTYQTNQASAASRAARPPDTPARTASAGDDGVTVDISPAGKLLGELPPIFLDPNYHMQKAETRLSELMQEMGIPPDTEIGIHLSSSGQFTVEGDHAKLAELQDMLNDGTEMDLRNALIGAHTASVIHSIAAASQKTQEKVEANPSAAERLWNQLLAEADRIKNQSMDFSYGGGSLSGVFGDGAAAIA